MEFVVLSPCPRHASGNVGDQLLLESALELIEDLHEPVEFNIHWRGEDFTSRLEYLNSADGILLCGFQFLNFQSGSGEYRIAEDLNAVEPPLIPIGAMDRFFPGDERALTNRRIDTETKSFLKRVAQNCPDEQIPVRSAWVGRVLRQNGFQTTLTGDPAWYDLDFIGEQFHAPDRIDQLVFTAPHFAMYAEQAKELLRRFSRQFSAAERTVVLHSAPTDIDRELIQFGRKYGWNVHYASHEVEHLELYRNSDLHVGYRLHGHLAHLRWRRPSILLTEDSRGQGLTETLGTAGFRAFKPRKGLFRRFGELYDWFPVFGLYFVLDKYGFENVLPQRRSLIAPPNPTAVDDVLEYVKTQQTNEWTDFTRIQSKIDETYEDGMKPFLESALAPLESSFK